MVKDFWFFFCAIDIKIMAIFKAQYVILVALNQTHILDVLSLQTACCLE